MYEITAKEHGLTPEEVERAQAGVRPDYGLELLLRGPLTQAQPSDVPQRIESGEVGQIVAVCERQDL